MQFVGYSNLLCSFPKYEHHIRKTVSPNWNSLILYYSIHYFLQSVAYITAILGINNVRFLLNIIYWKEIFWLQKSKENLLIATEKTGHEVNAEKPTQMFIPCEENIEEYQNIKKAIRLFVWNKKIKITFKNKLRAH
jgi:hypothetical protein